MTFCCPRPSAASTEGTRDPPAETRIPDAVVGPGPIGRTTAPQRLACGTVPPDAARPGRRQGCRG